MIPIWQAVAIALITGGIGTLVGIAATLIFGGVAAAHDSVAAGGGRSE
jgi:Na+/H+ antiporter NhaD/arsenite permease-like protein